MHGKKIHAYGMDKLEQFCAHCRVADTMDLVHS